jgi:hypothetical protein
MDLSASNCGAEIMELTNFHVRLRQKNQNKSSGRFLINSLDPEAQAIDRLRFNK